MIAKGTYFTFKVFPNLNRSIFFFLPFYLLLKVFPRIKYLISFTSLVRTKRKGPFLTEVIKVQLFWEGHKNLKKISHLFCRYWVKADILSKKNGRFFPILWPSHHLLTLRSRSHFQGSQGQILYFIYFLWVSLVILVVFGFDKNST